MRIQPTKNDPRPFAREIDSIVEQLRALPLDLALHQRLRETAIRHKAAGGRCLGFFETLRRSPKDPRQRLLHLVRLSAYDPGDPKLVSLIVQALEAYDGDSHDVEPLRCWFNQLLRTLRPTE